MIRERERELRILTIRPPGRTRLWLEKQIDPWVVMIPISCDSIWFLWVVIYNLEEDHIDLSMTYIAYSNYTNWCMCSVWCSFYLMFLLNFSSVHQCYHAVSYWRCQPLWLLLDICLPLLSWLVFVNLTRV